MFSRSTALLICDLMKRKSPFISLEFFPPKERDAWPGFFEVVEKLKVLDPLFASVTYGAGGGTQDNTLEIATRMKRDHGIEPLTHLTSVGASAEKLDGFLKSLREANIEKRAGPARRSAPGTGRFRLQHPGVPARHRCHRVHRRALPRDVRGRRGLSRGTSRVFLHQVRHRDGRFEGGEGRPGSWSLSCFSTTGSISTVWTGSEPWVCTCRSSPASCPS